MPNMMETAIAMLAATSIGAAWSSCATDIGSQAALDRLGQIEPKVLFTVNRVLFYKGKAFSSLRQCGRGGQRDSLPQESRGCFLHRMTNPT